MKLAVASYNEEVDRTWIPVDKLFSVILPNLIVEFYPLIHTANSSSLFKK